MVYKKDTKGYKNIEIIEDDFGISDITPRELILRHFDRLSQYIFKGEEVPTKIESAKGVTFQPDRRQVLCQAFDFAIGILKPFYDKGMEAKQKEFDKTKKEIEEELINNSIKYKAYARSIDPNFRNKNFAYEDWVKFFNKEKIISIDKSSGYYEFYISKKYSLYFGLFEQLNYLLSRKNYLASETFGGQ